MKAPVTDKIFNNAIAFGIIHELEMISISTQCNSISIWQAS